MVLFILRKLFNCQSQITQIIRYHNHRAHTYLNHEQQHARIYSVYASSEGSAEYQFGPVHNMSVHFASVNSVCAYAHLHCLHLPNIFYCAEYQVGPVNEMSVLIASVNSEGSGESAYAQTRRSLRCSHKHSS